MLWIRCPANILRLVAVPASHIPLNPLLLFPPPRLEGLVLRMDPVEPPGAFTWRVIEPTAKDTTIETTTEHDFEVSLVTVKHLISDVVLP
jgi:hypothetical protein